MSGLFSTDTPSLGASSMLGRGDGELSADLHNRLDVALTYIANWYKATKGAANQDVWWTKIDQVRAKVENAERTITSDDVFPSKTEVALYNDASDSYAGLFTELYNSYDTIPQPALLDQAADLTGTIVEFPSYVVTRAADLVGRTIGDSAKALFVQTWPVLLVAGVVGGVYLFRRPLARLAGAL